MALELPRYNDIRVQRGCATSFRSHPSCNEEDLLYIYSILQRGELLLTSISLERFSNDAPFLISSPIDINLFPATAIYLMNDPNVYHVTPIELSQVSIYSVFHI